MLIRFRIRGSVRYLSHAETVKVFQRACVRAGIRVQHSGGFNPRPKLSLPLPRSVGVETDDDLLCLRAAGCGRADKGLKSSIDGEQFKASLCDELPEGIEVLGVRVGQAKTTFEPRLATYLLAVRAKYLNEKLKATIKGLLASESLNLERLIDAKKSRFKNVDVRGFLKSIELDDEGIVVECRISSAGSIRVEEILKLLELDAEKLAAPIRRTRVQWQEKTKD